MEPTIGAILVLGTLGFMLLAVMPVWPYSRGWGYPPAGMALIMLLAWLLRLSMPLAAG